MKRWVWLVLLAFGTMLTHVPAVELPVPAEPSSCCGCEGKCAMPDCAPSPGTPAPVMERAATVTRASQPVARTARRGTFADRELHRINFSSTSPASPAHAPASTAAPGRLFERYCSWLI